MEQTGFGDKLRRARKVAGYTQRQLGDAIGVSEKAVRTWETGQTASDRIDPASRVNLRKVLGDFDAEGDPVEVAIRRSGLVKWRQDRVISVYEEHVYDQGREAAG